MERWQHCATFYRLGDGEVSVSKLLLPAENRNVVSLTSWFKEKIPGAKGRIRRRSTWSSLGQETIHNSIPLTTLGQRRALCLLTSAV